MQVNRTLEQQIAVFGESGSGKTVLLSSFYGAAQEPQFLKSSQFKIVADDIGQGHRLHRNYLGMRDSAQTPQLTRFSGTSYSFSIKLSPGKSSQSAPFDALRLIWHDYPGDWFEQSVTGQEAQNRADTFRSLLGSDVAFLLVDGQRLLDNSGEEERYLKSLLTGFRVGLESLKDDLLEDGKPLVRFPRIWIFALSKADLLTDYNVFTFRDLLISKVAGEIAELRGMLSGLVEAKEALSVGEDYVLLSSAKFEPGKIEVTQRVGLDLVLPLASMLPFERHVRWAKAKKMGGKVAAELLSGVGELASVIVGVKLPGPLARFAVLLAAVSNLARVIDDLAGDKLKEFNAEARAKHDHLRATLTGFQLEIEKGEKDQILLRSLS